MILYGHLCMVKRYRKSVNTSSVGKIKTINTLKGDGLQNTQVENVTARVVNRTAVVVFVMQIHKLLQAACPSKGVVQG